MTIQESSMTRQEIIKAANKVLSYNHLEMMEAMERVLGTFGEDNKDEFSAVYDEVQNILYPHGTGEDAVYCEN
ncbi:hypothetical protein pEaSNUABM44_00037 [Erwinia phage pEa_SNUABM_44]|nr:hypothetical protein pEaSNUABM44_00037 [Erwinia phage pEa_SNUABM_44]